MQCKTLIGLVCSAMLSLAVHAQPTNQNQNQNIRSLTLKECVELALAHNLDIQIDRYSPQIANYLLKAAYGGYDPFLELTAKRTFVNQPPQFDPKKYAPPIPGASLRQDSEYELTTDTLGPSVLGRLPTGLSYNLFARSDHLDATTFPTAGFTTPPNVTNDYYATVGVTLRQPLLKDFWIDLNRRNIAVQKNNLKMSELQFRTDVMKVVTRIETNYYNLILAREEITVERKALELASQLFEETRRKVQAGQLPPLEEKQAESGVETIKTSLFAAEQNYQNQENMLKNEMTDRFQSWMDVQIMPSDDLTVIDLPANRSVSWVNALTLRPDVLQRRVDLERQDINLKFTYNQLFPSFDLVGSYGLQAVQRHFGDTWSDIGTGQNPFYSVGVVFSIPLGNTTARNDHKAAQLAKERAFLQYKRLEQDVITEVDTAVKAAETAFKQIKSSHKATEFAQAALDVEQTKYLNGTTTSFFVLEFQRNLTRARLAEMRALADYNVALAHLALSEGTTLDKNHIELKLK